MIGVKKTITPFVGRLSRRLSLIGVHGEPPHSWGNYFYLCDGERVWNFWYENLQAALLRFLLDGQVDTIQYQNGCIIHDKRIPTDWYYNKLCFTGGPLPLKEEAREIYDILGDPTNEYEQFEDPESYYKKRGRKYNSKLHWYN